MSSVADATTLLRLARQDLESGNLDAAQAKCLQILGSHQHHPGALEVMGEILFAQGRLEDAARVFNALTLIQPEVAQHWQNLGTVLRPMQQTDQALAAFDRALQLSAPTAGLLYNLGVLQMDRCNYRAAHVALRDAVALAPPDATIRWAFAQCCFDLSRLEEAHSALENWDTFSGLNPEVTVLITLLLVMMGAIPQAQPGVRRLLANPPRQGRAVIRFASILERLHRIEEARAAMGRLERDDPALAAEPESLLMSAVLADRVGERGQARKQLLTALQKQPDIIHRHKFLYPLAKVCDGLGLHEEAFAAAAEAHRSQLAFLQAAIGTAAPEESQIWSLTAADCDPDDVKTWSSHGPGVEESPIFVVGFPRSGTTLLEQLLDAHPRLQSMDEQPFLFRSLEEVRQHGIAYPAELGKLSDAALADIRVRYWDRARERGQWLPGHRLVDKNPLHMLLLPLIRRLFPDARIILALRHPCDTLLSCFLQHFRAPGLALVCRDLPTLAKAYDRAFSYWYSQWPQLQPASYELQYERLTADFESEVRRLNDFLQLPWDDAMLEPDRHARTKGFINTPSYAQVLEPVSSRSVGRWKNYERHFTEALPLLRPWLQRWGYQTD